MKSKQDFLAEIEQLKKALQQKNAKPYKERLAEYERASEAFRRIKADKTWIYEQYAPRAPKKENE